jgi:hypothetical protein
VVGKERPGRQIEWMLAPRAVQGDGHPLEIGILQPGPLFEQTHGHKEITVGKEGTPEPRPGARIQHRERTFPEKPPTSKPEDRATRFEERVK